MDKKRSKNFVLGSPVKLRCYQNSKIKLKFFALQAGDLVVNNSTLLLMISDRSGFGSGEFVFTTFQAGPKY